MVITSTPSPDPTSRPSSYSISAFETATTSADPDSAGDAVDPPLHDRPWIEPYGRGFVPSRVASEAITRSIKQQYLSPWPTWGAIPIDDREPFWQRFKPTPVQPTPVQPTPVQPSIEQQDDEDHSDDDYVDY
ncbi:hypothetical protein LR48_Vigan03g185600 [Vigna angularis]|uniref:Uncharacterized protein n=1 Tax=Phaseolus angularis TaxID=3914 RepID=A0A0L9U7R3_PHAAN|nr:hypothetical protein LR48_Vigan03g185600 [Vigna angularis]